jgi:hypothetical protein
MPICARPSTAFERRPDLVAHVCQKACLGLCRGPGGIQRGLQVSFRGLLRGHVADQADERAAVVVHHFVDRELDGEQAAILASSLDMASLTNDVRPPRLQVAVQVVVMGGSMGFRHQHTDVATDQFFFLVAEHVQNRMIYRQDVAGGIDMHHAVEHGAQDRAAAGLRST